MNTLLERLETVAKRYDELTQILMDPDIANDIALMTKSIERTGIFGKGLSDVQGIQSPARWDRGGGSADGR